MKESVYKSYDELPLFINPETGRQIRWFPAERKTRYYIAIKMPNRAAETMANAIKAETFPEFPQPP